MVDLFGDDVNPERISRYEEAISTGAIGVGKTTLASIVIPYMVHWVLCLKDPQKYYNLMAGTRIAFMMMSTNRLQARDVVYSDIKARIDNSPWFQQHGLYDPKVTTQFRFQKEIWIIPGDSSERTFEGFNILGGIVDEIDSHKVTKDKSYVEVGYDTISGRMKSRFQDRGFLLLIGQMKSQTGFAAKQYKKMSADPACYAVRMSIWESVGWDKFTNALGERESFWFDCDRMEITTKSLAALQGYPDHIIEVPNTYQKNFIESPYKALRDLGGRPAAVTAPLFGDPGKLETARQYWHMRVPHAEGPVDHKNRVADWFKAENSVKRAVHVDIAYSSEGDALGIAMGHVPEVVDVEGEEKPFIFIDFMMRIKAPPGREIQLADIRRIVYDLIDRRNFNIVTLTTDGFQSTDFRQQIARRRIHTDIVSTDKTTLPYFDLYDAVMEERIAIPPYLTPLSVEEPDPIDILYREISQLTEENNKIDHPPDGSKDLADAVACVTSTLMGAKKYKRSGQANTTTERVGTDRTAVRTPFSGTSAVAPAFTIPRAPVPPQIGGIKPASWRPR